MGTTGRVTWLTKLEVPVNHNRYGEPMNISLSIVFPLDAWNQKQSPK